MTGILLLAAYPTVKRDVIRALSRNNNMKTYWVITTAIPNQTEGTEKLAMEWKSNPNGHKMVILKINV